MSMAGDPSTLRSVHPDRLRGWCEPPSHMHLRYGPKPPPFTCHLRNIAWDPLRGLALYPPSPLV